MKAAIAVAVLACAVYATDALATSTIVPDNYATVQAAIDANKDTVWVKAGTYNETVSITHGVLLSNYANTYSSGVPVVLRVLGVSVPGTVTMQGFHVLRTFSVTAQSGASITRCRADSGLTCSANMGSAFVSGCTVFGPLAVTGGYFQATLNTVVGGTLSGYSNAGTCSITSNFVQGPAAVGIIFGDDVSASDNLVRGCVDGIQLGCGYYTGATQNVVEDCSGNGIVAGTVACHSSSAYVAGNTVRRCGGMGIAAYGTGPTIDGNTVDSTGSTGMYLPVTTDHVDNNRVSRANGAGIVVTTLPGHMRGNTVLRCAGDGIRVGLCALIDHNVVGHNTGAGIVVTADNGSDRLRSNTAFLNGGPGFSLQTSDASLDSVVDNIGFGNQVGLQRLGAGSITLGCNDWYGNLGGAVSGVGVGASDFALDPQFCNAPADLVTLAQSSPALNRAGCGLVGALGQGCTVPAGVAGDVGAFEASLRAYPQPNRGAVRFTWKPVSEKTRLEVFDAQGALRYSRDVPAGTQELSWPRTGSGGRALPAGVYFARLRARAGELGSCRVVALN